MPDIPAHPDTTTRILLLRHGETSHPALFHGAESDVGLGPAGRAQAAAVAPWLHAQRPAAVYSSGLRRALETASIIADRCGLPATVREALHERRMGALSGRDRVEGWPLYEAARDRWKAGDLHATHAGGESYASIRDRVLPVLAEIASRHRGGGVVVVAHGVVIRVAGTSLLEGFSPADWDRIGIDFVAVHDLRTDGRRWWHEGLNLNVHDGPAPAAPDPHRG
jgi:broad specificity phosphatase PhoE